MPKSVHPQPVPHAIFPNSAQSFVHHKRNAFIAAIAMGLLGAFQISNTPQWVTGTLAFNLTYLAFILLNPSIVSALAVAGSIYIVCFLIFEMLKLYKLFRSN